MSLQDRRDREKEELKNKIIQVAEETLVQEGFEKLSLRKIAKAIEYSPTTIYLYFKDKADLVNHIVERGLQDFMQRMAALPEAVTSDPIVHLKEGMKTYVRFGLENPAMYQVIFASNLRESNEHGRFMTAGISNEQGFAMLAQGIKNCVAQGSLPDLDVDLTVRAFWAAQHGLVMSLIAQGELSVAERDAIIDHLLDTIIKGIQINK
jgi:AcrR family transcriptional regulator